uniref:Myb/SANT-like DNA-binding domain-containing protein n=1 Tax=Chelonoidis abingdonii TaxID=106734 RepID=A0A8C0JEU4_CHEAB
ISKAMMEKGHTRDSVQCRVKVKELRQAYQKTKEANGRSGAGPKTCRVYAELHAVLGGPLVYPTPVSGFRGGVVISAVPENSVDGEDEEDELAESTQHSVSPKARSFFSPRRNYPPSPPNPLAQTMKPWKRPLVSAPL